MNLQKAPRSLRFEAAVNSLGQTVENNSGKTVSAVAGLIAVASFSGAEAQQSNLPPVTVDAPVARPRPAASKPSPDQLRARTALRRAARRAQPAQVAPVPFPNAGGLARRSRSLRGPCGALQGGSRAGVRQVSGAAVEHAEDYHGAHKGGAPGQEHHLAARDRALDRRCDTGVGRGRQCVRRSVLHPRFRCAQRRLHRRHPRPRRQRSAKISSPSRSRSCVARRLPMPAVAPPAAPSTSSPSRPVIVTSTTPRARSAPTTPSASRSTSTR